MKKVLILTASFGDGHNAAARNLRDALEAVSPESQVEVLDLFESCYGPLNSLARSAYLNVIRFAPQLWNGFYNLVDRSRLLDGRLGGTARLRNALGDILHQTQPDCVVSVYPSYAHVIQDLYRDHAERPFRFITVITDSISINSAWFRAPSDAYCVANAPTAAVLRVAGVPGSAIRAYGFPVAPLFEGTEPMFSEPPVRGEPRRLLYIINSGRKKAGKVIERLLEVPDTHLTITVGRDAGLKSELKERTRECKDRVRVLGWTNQMPHLMLTNHLVIGKAGGATVQEAIAARCPMIVNQVVPGQEEGNARIIRQFGLGAVAEKARDIAQLVEQAFADRGRLWHEWRDNLLKVARPDAAMRIAEFILAECDWTDSARKTVRLPPAREHSCPDPGPAVGHARAQRLLMCDFHIHSNYSDGKLTVPEVVDFYGRRGFDCICITDHLADPRRLIGKLSRLTNLTVSPEQLEEYFAVIERESRRAWRKYRMHVLTGIEFNKDGLTRKSSAHLLGIGLQAPVAPALDLPETIAQIHAQGGLAVASHPHLFKSEWGKNTLHLWENLDTYGPLLDAWEIANRNDIFTPVGWRKLPFLANSDFHKPKHIYSWKTLLFCDKDPDAIKACVRRNEHVSITLYRDDLKLPAAVAPASLPRTLEFQMPLPLNAAHR
jgi:UDP-N-acetylglucosamine:LPS N-acetylglucosamine transferase/predicted metal-dependent phosphoesterase TrpH